MKQPAFTWWPWRFLAIASPLFALGGAVLAGLEHRPPKDVFAIFFSVLAAANGYLFAMAVGDFGRSIFAIPLGAAAGYAAVFVFSFPLPNVLFTIFLFLVAGFSVSARVMKAFPGCLTMAFLFFTFMAFLQGVWGRNATIPEPKLCIFNSYPFICGCVAATLPIENTFSAVFHAGLAGIRAALNGMVMGMAVTFGLGFVLLFFQGSGSRRAEEVIASVAVCLAAASVNYFCVQNIFTAVHRAEGSSSNEPAERTQQSLPEETDDIDNFVG